MVAGANSYTPHLKWASFIEVGMVPRIPWGDIVFGFQSDKCLQRTIQASAKGLKECKHSKTKSGASQSYQARQLQGEAASAGRREALWEQR